MLAMPPEVFGELFPLFSAASPENDAMATIGCNPAQLSGPIVPLSWKMLGGMQFIFFGRGLGSRFAAHVDDGFVSAGSAGERRFFLAKWLF